MHSEKIDTQDVMGATLIRSGDTQEIIGVTGYYTAKCFDADGNVKWEDVFENTVVTEGKAKLFNVNFASGSPTTTWYLGLVNNTPTPNFTNVSDTLASHSWTELTDYAGVRKTATFTTTATNSISASPASFVMNASVTVAGAFLATVSSGTSGTLYSAGAFTGGNRTVVSGDTIVVTYTTSA